MFKKKISTYSDLIIYFNNNDKKQKFTVFNSNNGQKLGVLYINDNYTDIDTEKGIKLNNSDDVLKLNGDTESLSGSSVTNGMYDPVTNKVYDEGIVSLFKLNTSNGKYYPKVYLEPAIINIGGKTLRHRKTKRHSKKSNKTRRHRKR